MNAYLIDFQRHGDSRGNLIAIEESKECPFSVKRVYYMFDTGKGVRRGYHSHKKLEQILICTSGSCKIHLDNGMEQQEIVLDNPSQGLFIGNNIWREMYDFSPGAVLMVLASELYDESDYIRDYQQYMKSVEDAKIKK